MECKPLILMLFLVLFAESTIFHLLIPPLKFTPGSRSIQKISVRREKNPKFVTSTARLKLYLHSSFSENAIGRSRYGNEPKVDNIAVSISSEKFKSKLSPLGDYAFGVVLIVFGKLLQLLI